ncbi:MAG: BadF/BadG/BcrA/BcrD ATPase family protein [Clostridia bacterium]
MQIEQTGKWLTPCPFVLYMEQRMINTTLFLTVVGGGTKTEAILAYVNGHIAGLGCAAGSNALSVGKEQAIQAVLQAIHQALGDTAPQQVAMAKLFIPGFAHCLPLPFPFETPVYGDAINAYFGALGAPGGIAVLCGTGSFAVSYREDGSEVSIGGWGPMLGDEGSGYDIGRRAVRMTLERFDRGLAPTALGQAVLAHYAVEGANRLVHSVYHGGCDREHMARLSPIVGEHARQREPDALQIIAEVAHEIAAMALTLKERLHLQAAPMALTGGVSNLGETVLAPLRAELRGTGLTLISPKYPPVLGGVLYTHWQLTGEMPEQEVAERYFKAYQNLKGSR